MEEIAGWVGLKPEFPNTRWETILHEMQDGRYHCIVGGITITPEGVVTFIRFICQ
jgi:Bacterial extracellular solute-binding proteins, family 3